MKNTFCVLAVVVAATSPVSAQWSSDIPGVPRAAVPFAGARQGRVEFEALYFKFPAPSGDDTLAFGLRFGVGRSYRIGTRIEAGFDLTVLEGIHVREQIAGGGDGPPSYTRAATLYGLRVGAKFTPVSSVSPEGYGYHAAIGAALQPSVQPVFGFSMRGDSSDLGGVFVDDEGGADPVVDALPRSLQIGLLGSYRTRRFIVDGGLMIENMADRAKTDSTYPVVEYSGVSPRLGALARLTGSVALGFSWWGAGAPPWRDRLVIGGPSEENPNWGVVLSLGSRLEAGTDLMLSAPRGSLSDGARLYVRGRSTF